MSESTADDWPDYDEALFKTAPKKKSDSGYTYVVVASGLGVKIGHSRTPAKRLSSMKVGCPVNMWFGHTWRLSPDGAKHLERQLHVAFRWASLQGEWFNVLAGEVVAVGDLFVAGRVEAARKLVGLVEAQRDIEHRLDRLRFAWRYATGKPRERSEFERLAKLQLPEVEREHARNELAAFELGLWMRSPITTIGGRQALERLKEQAS